MTGTRIFLLILLTGLCLAPSHGASLDRCQTEGRQR